METEPRGEWKVFQMTPETFCIADLRCAICKSPEIMAIKPGTADETQELLGTVLVIKRGVETQAFCRKHVGR